ncbi:MULTISPECIES: hypothetical protein [unclassified Arthrobacter]|uniref:hypothetical protein n=1 Tax=unclassified Arthrobacter TaxID=235627 RepID=UPI001D148B8E|nr:MULTISPECIES: hypothetical protein [unclassified Arthrobacter]MCC3278671.1 hypothetical protein [Arthrobacter sp. zg-Y40]MCC9177038.1 hypothetical protein [Arthrobacter sp. zg-Y750]MDK1326251.1 hypothetical protein [Arthrobacter sp. zg-Y1143]
MPEYPLPSLTLPDSMRPDAGFERAAAPLPPPRPPGLPAPALQRALKEVSSMFQRLRSSYLRSSAVRSSRLDYALSGEQGYLLLHYFHSVK